MKKSIATFIALMGWATLIIRIKWRIETETVSITESVIRFLSYFTILTNLFVTIYFTAIAWSKKEDTFFHKPGMLAALAAFISFVGLIYHLLLRSLWNPEGLQMVTDEIHHTFALLLTIIFWVLYEKKKELTLKNTMIWFLYPFLYLIWVLSRGLASSFYPYYFLDVTTLGLRQVLLNSLGLFIGLVFFLLLFYFIGKKLSRNR